jgi:predicted esterase
VRKGWLCVAGLVAFTAEPRTEAQNKAAAISASATLERGVVVERVPCTGTPEQTYALYLPSRYSPDRKWPIVYAFDPGARGAMPVRLAKDAAERFGWVVAASNNSRNGPWQDTAVAIDNLLRDTTARVAIDPQRVYTAGLSGGARVATNLAMACKGCVVGVFAQGAGLPIGVKLDKEHAGFAWFGSVGLTDFNYPELLTLDHDLRALDVKERLRVFAGGHQWAPSEVWMEALEWFELLAMNDGRRTRDEALLTELLTSANARSAALEREADVLGLARELRVFARDFAGRPEAAAAEARVKTILPSREYRDAERREHKALEEQDRATSDFARGLQWLHEGNAERIEALARAKQGAVQLKGDVEREKDKARRTALERALGGAFVQVMEEGQGLLREKRGDAALGYFDVGATLRPEASGPHVQRARAYALDGKKDDALRALRRATELGLERADLARALETQVEFAALRGDPGVRELTATPSPK